MLKYLKFFAAAKTSIKGYLNTEELIRVVIASVLSGCGLYGVLSAIGGDLPAIVAGPENVALASAVFTAVLDVMRRLGHGGAPVYVQAK